MKPLKKIVLLRSMDMLPDPRVEKYVEYYKTHSIPYTLVGWNRSEATVSKEQTEYFHQPAPFGAGAANAKALIGFNKFLFRWLYKNRKQYTSIHAADLDTVMPALLIKLLCGKRVVFDVFDWYSDSRELSGWFAKAVRVCERLAVKCADAVVICDEQRVEQIPCKIPARKLIVLPNVPQYVAEEPYVPLNITTAKFDQNRTLKLAYVGIFGPHRGLEDLLEAVVTNQQTELTIGGFGELTPLVERYAAKCTRIDYVGKLQYAQSLQTMRQADIICALYYTTIRNHIFAAPNKYYEGLYLGRPILTTKGTIPGKNCEKYQVGFALDEGLEPLARFLNDVDPQTICRYGANARRLWTEKFADLWNRTMDVDYRQRVSL